MKAKEYAQVIIDNGYSLDSIMQMTKDLHGEILPLIKARHGQSLSAINSVFKEMDQKYRAICRIVNKDSNILKDDGFKTLLKHHYQDTNFISEIDYFKERT